MECRPCQGKEILMTMPMGRKISSPFWKQECIYRHTHSKKQTNLTDRYIYSLYNQWIPKLGQSGNAQCQSQAKTQYPMRRNGPYNLKVVSGIDRRLFILLNLIIYLHSISLFTHFKRGYTMAFHLLAGGVDLCSAEIFVAQNILQNVNIHCRIMTSASPPCAAAAWVSCAAKPRFSR